MNPEFKRNLILSASPFRQLILPLSMLAIIYLFYLINGQYFGQSLATACAIIFLVVMLLWGSREVSDSLMDEMQEKTWDFQRMSSMGAWPMVWGKIVGASFYISLSALIALLAYAYSIQPLVNVTFLIKSCLLLILVAGIGLSVSFLSTLFLIRKNPQTNSKMTNGVILILGFYLLFVSIPLVELEQHTTISWYLLQFNWLNFNIVSAMAFLAWLLIAAYRLMRQELQYKNSPLVWTIFVLFVLFYCAGFLLDINLANSYELSKFSNSLVYLQSLAPYLFVLMILISWLSIYFSDNSLPVFHRFIYACSEKKLSQIWLYCPLWLVTYVFLIVSAFWLYLNTSFNPAVDILSSLWFGQTSLYHPDFILLCLLFVLRDILISIYFNFKNAFNRPDSSALVFIILLYVLLPSILNLTLGKQWLFIFLPIFYEQTWFNLVPVVFQVVLMLFLVIRLYKQKSP